MAAIYRTLLEEIRADGCHVLKQRVSLTPVRKLWIAWRTWIKAERRSDTAVRILILPSRILPAQVKQSSLGRASRSLYLNRFVCTAVSEPSYLNRFI
jgi:hypothetical protein